MLGDVKVEALGDLRLKDGTTVAGNVEGKGAQRIRISAGTIVEGNVKVKDTGKTWFGPVSVSIAAGTTIGGKLEIKRRRGTISLVRVTVGKKVKIEKTEHEIFIWDSQFSEVEKNAKNAGLVDFGPDIGEGHIVKDNVKLEENNGGIVVMDNTIERDLKCKSNADPVTVSMNDVFGTAKGQCAAAP